MEVAMSAVDIPEIPVYEGLTPEQVITLSRARWFKQFKGMIQSYRSGACLFCDPLGPKNKVIHEALGWRMWVNPIPEKHSARHLVMAPVEHISPEDEIVVDDFTAIGELFSWAKQEFKFKGGGLLMRFGSTWFNAGTILHLHVNIIVPDGSNEVRVPLAKTPEKVQAGFTRLQVFMKMLNGTAIKDPTEGEREIAAKGFKEPEELKAAGF